LYVSCNAERNFSAQTANFYFVLFLPRSISFSPKTRILHSGVALHFGSYAVSLSPEEPLLRVQACNLSVRYAGICRLQLALNLLPYRLKNSENFVKKIPQFQNINIQECTADITVASLTIRWNFQNNSFRQIFTNKM
jgi:hypothetical protein